MFDSIRRMLFGNNKNRNRNFSFRSRTSNCKRCVYNLVNFEQAKNMIESQNVILIDVRTSNEYEFMHIKNAINIPVDEIANRINEINDGRNIMVYCASGARSKNAILTLNNFGINNIYIWEYGALATFPYRDLIEYGNKK